ncbi:hypothetical protein CMQ_1763 [Grosmannia clavigera kw1407]|uniref:Uncharacterized protein n=1 Tax=Grosmannia clavigera (strain kw1407 / UAMH 11150) TaxID=655863 RepID=F0XAZ4_GROCL|nr:uncharacterized protein CMQ_1763 [Grosmannia clavigera kw1407]EFX05127.1 hypothetical protein CMQ_1763 [Grosmannia clavigera kw1407]
MWVYCEKCRRACPRECMNSHQHQFLCHFRGCPQNRRRYAVIPVAVQVDENGEPPAGFYAPGNYPAPEGPRPGSGPRPTPHNHNGSRNRNGPRNFNGSRENIPRPHSSSRSSAPPPLPRSPISRARPTPWRPPHGYAETIVSQENVAGESRPLSPRLSDPSDPFDPSGNQGNPCRDIIRARDIVRASGPDDDDDDDDDGSETEEELYVQDKNGKWVLENDRPRECGRAGRHECGQTFEMPIRGGVHHEVPPPAPSPPLDNPWEGHRSRGNPRYPPNSSRNATVDFESRPAAPRPRERRPSEPREESRRSEDRRGPHIERQSEGRRRRSVSRPPSEYNPPGTPRDDVESGYSHVDSGFRHVDSGFQQHRRSSRSDSQPPPPPAPSPPPTYTTPCHPHSHSSYGRGYGTYRR